MSAYCASPQELLTQGMSLAFLELLET